jgi:DNA repair protein RadA/Sms
MARFQTKYICQSCGHESLKWLGKCPECESWDTLVEEVTMQEKPQSARSSGSASLRMTPGGPSKPIPITDVVPIAQARIITGIGEFDRVLGGGIVPGGLILVGGDPGIGKSTLLTQVVHAIATQHGPTIYVSGEESAQQIRLRSARLGAESSEFYVTVETDISTIVAQIAAMNPRLAVIDSVQTVSDASLESAPGTVSQVRTCAMHLARLAKSTGIPIVLIGHVTKEGSLAGPRVLEHVVDTVLYFEGDRYHAYRLLRAAKNRFGSTDELGIFEMRESGLKGVDNPSEALLAERSPDGPGSAVASMLEGSRALLIEMQALVTRSNLGSPRRAVTGMDPSRVNMILAVLEKRIGLRLAEQDVFVNVAGGMRVNEPSADLACAMAIASSFREQPVHPSTAMIGEIGLAGEVRAVAQAEKRVREAARQGFTRAVISGFNAAQIPSIPGIEVVPVHNVLEALNSALTTPVNAPPPEE